MNFAKICKYIIDAAEERHMQMQNDNQLFLCMFVERGGEKCVCHVFPFWNEYKKIWIGNLKGPVAYLSMLYNQLTHQK